MQRKPTFWIIRTFFFSWQQKRIYTNIIQWLNFNKTWATHNQVQILLLVENRWREECKQEPSQSLQEWLKDFRTTSMRGTFLRLNRNCFRIFEQRGCDERLSIVRESLEDFRTTMMRGTFHDCTRIAWGFERRGCEECFFGCTSIASGFTNDEDAMNVCRLYENCLRIFEQRACEERFSIVQESLQDSNEEDARNVFSVARALLQDFRTTRMQGTFVDCTRIASKFSNDEDARNVSSVEQELLQDFRTTRMRWTFVDCLRIAYVGAHDFH